MKKVSVIVPVYNSEKYLEKCLDSVAEQTLEDIEIIAVNDGSSDRSVEILENYAKIYPNKLKVLHKENGGLSDARNFGMRHAQGEYIGFVDSDDWVEKDMFELMYQKAKEESYDVVVCDFKEIRNGREIPYTSEVQADGQGKEYIKANMLEIYSAAWNKIYKKEILDENLFTKGIWHEDVEFLYRVLPRINSIGVVHKCLYNYLIRKGSISNSANIKMYDQVRNWNSLMKFYKDNGIYNEYKEEIEYCYVRYLFALFVKSATAFDRQGFKKAVEEAIKNVKATVPNYKNNRYLKQKGAKKFYLRHFNKMFADVIYMRFHNERA